MATARDTDLDTPALALLWAARETGLLAALIGEQIGRASCRERVSFTV